MKVYLYDPTYPEAEDEHDEYVARLKGDAGKVNGYKKLELVDIEYGAGCPGFVLSYDWFVAGTIAVLFAGPAIAKLIEGWIKLADQLTSLLDLLRSKGHEPFVDEESAALLGLKRILEEEKNVSSLHLLEHIRIGHVYGDFYSSATSKDALQKNPGESDPERLSSSDTLFDESEEARAAAHGCNVFIFAVNRVRVVTVGVGTSGEIHFVGSIPFLDEQPEASKN